ncbi:hypothetical protein N9R90_01205 [Flavobacteriaceae bacterium]|jgi:hypothetical protein|nr:hypothetical protein [Cryomorphaceae bacterium]MDA9276568.1 hypothetical protein [Flavobacteriaceae bacterium]MBT3684381.1 hypothetical protein [Cryomorphaceae bacterium]MBT4236674.1 hypothetical protein [Cryomorphaceae bacterium]MBT4813618.1 hypothetical protein [Cryomorphaceae bacterium]
MRDLNIRIKQKFNEVIPFDEKGTTWASFLNILITSKKPEDVMKYLGVYEAEEIDAMIDDLSSFTDIRIDLLEDMMWGKS